jgi:hypothetical protein
MSLRTHVTIPRIASLSAFLLLGAVLRASSEAGISGALGVVKILGTPAAMIVFLLGFELLERHFPVRRSEESRHLSRQVVIFALCAVDLVLLAVIVLGVGFLAKMIDHP